MAKPSAERAAVVVAHPDDETIWCGGLICMRSAWDWTVVSVCRGDDPDREPRFRAACLALGASGFISDLDDGSPPAGIDPAADIAPRVVETIGGGRWDLVVTHGANGEYGHPRHKETHEAVRGLVASGALRAAEFWSFAYECDASTGHSSPASDADVVVDLSDDVFEEKTGIIREIYGFGPDSFEVRACGRREAFRRSK
jgi:LmbE family N-acetylglucosaminyl deacetylase